MKVENSFPNTTHSLPELQKTGRTLQNSPRDQVKSRQAETPPKLIQHKKYQSQVGITRKEKEFFEGLFSKTQKEIRAYVEKQENIVYEKGQLIDFKG